MTRDRKIRIGVLVDRDYLHHWEALIIQDIIKEEDLNIEYILNASENGTPFLRIVKLIHQNPYGLFWIFVDNIERYLSKFLYSNIPNKIAHLIDKKQNLSGFASSVEILRISPLPAILGGYVRFKHKDIAHIKERRFDVILWFGSQKLKGEILDATRFGIWYFSYSNNPMRPVFCPGFWEFFDNEPTTTITLRVLRDDLDNEVVLCRASYTTFHRSWNQNRRLLCWKSRLLIIDGLKHLARLDHVPETINDRLYGINDKPSPSSPNFLEIVQAVCRIVIRNLKHLLSRILFRKKWKLLVSIGHPSHTSLQNYTVLEPPRDQGWADPFLFARGHIVYAFIEDYSCKTYKGSISVLSLNKGKISEYRNIINCDYHMSFPFIFEHQANIYMIPETASNNTIEVWKCEDFPYSWVKEGILIQGVSAVDSVIIKHEELFWLFTTLDRVGLGDHCYELHIFFSEDPLSCDWRPHQKNPVKIDTLSARNGGRVFKASDGRLIRTAQENSYNYGYGLKFFEIIDLTPEHYKEDLLEKILPRWSNDIIGVHHFDSCKGLTIIDACFNIRKFMP